MSRSDANVIPANPAKAGSEHRIGAKVGYGLCRLFQRARLAVIELR
jgi:hypothetical protein